MKKSIEQRLQALEGRNQTDDLPSAIAWTAIDPLMSEGYGFGRIHSRHGSKTIEFHCQEDVDNFLEKKLE